MQEKLFLIGIGLIFLGIFITIIASFLSGSGKVEYGVGGFIGPIPFGWASNKNMLYVIIGLTLILFILTLFFLK